MARTGPQVPVISEATIRVVPAVVPPWGVQPELWVTLLFMVRPVPLMLVLV